MNEILENIMLEGVKHIAKINGLNEDKVTRQFSAYIYYSAGTTETTGACREELKELVHYMDKKVV